MLKNIALQFSVLFQLDLSDGMSWLFVIKLTFFDKGVENVTTRVD